MVVMASEIDGRRFQQGIATGDEEGRIPDAVRRLSSCCIDLVEGPALTVMQICSLARQHKARHGTELLVVDYLGLIEPDNPNAQRNDQISRQTRKLKQLALELKIPIVLLAQLNRESEKRGDGKPKLSDLRDSGAIEQDADVVVLLHRPDGDQPSASTRRHPGADSQK